MFILCDGSHGYLAWQDYATNKPYQNNIVLESLKIAFGSMMNIRDTKHYGYSHKDYCKEREVPAYMVAVAATAVGFFSRVSFLFYIVWSSFQDYATLQHILYDSNGNVELSTPVLESVFRGPMIRLLGWQGKKLAIYHKFTHRLYKDIMWVFALYQWGNCLIPIFQC